MRTHKIPQLSSVGGSALCFPSTYYTCHDSFCVYFEAQRVFKAEKLLKKSLRRRKLDAMCHGSWFDVKNFIEQRLRATEIKLSLSRLCMGWMLYVRSNSNAKSHNQSALLPSFSSSTSPNSIFSSCSLLSLDSIAPRFHRFRYPAWRDYTMILEFVLSFPFSCRAEKNEFETFSAAFQSSLSSAYFIKFSVDTMNWNVILINLFWRRQRCLFFLIDAMSDLIIAIKL